MFFCVEWFGSFVVASLVSRCDRSDLLKRDAGMSSLYVNALSSKVWGLLEKAYAVDQLILVPEYLIYGKTKVKENSCQDFESDPSAAEPALTGDAARIKFDPELKVRRIGIYYDHAFQCEKNTLLAVNKFLFMAKLTSNNALQYFGVHKEYDISSITSFYSFALFLFDIH